MRKTRKSYKGGFLGFSEGTNSSYPSSSYPSSNYPSSSYSNTYSTNNNSGLDSVLGSVKNAYNSASQSVSNAYNNISNPTPSYTYEDPNKKPWWKFWGGKRSRKIRGGAQVGYPDLSLATDVNGIKVVEPTYWIKGGKRSKSKRNKKSRRYRKK